MRAKLSLDLDAGFLAAAFGAVYAALAALFRGGFPGRMSGIAFVVLVGVFAVAGMSVGSVIAGKPDFGPTKRAALVRGFVAAIPVYAAGGLLFLSPDRWFTLIPIVSVVAAAIVGPPIGVFMYRLHRRVDSPESVVDPDGQLAWLKGELVGSWLPLLFSIAVLAALGVGMRAVPTVDPTAVAPRAPVAVVEQLPDLYRSVEADSTDAAARHDLGLALTSLGGFRDAVRHLIVATALDSSNAEYWRALGRAHYFGRDYPGATEAYWNAIRIDPTAIPGGGIDRVAIDASLTLMLRLRGEAEQLIDTTPPD
jgi:hypothetical protein